MKRRDYLERFLTHRHRFFLGIALILPWILQKNLIIKVSLFMVLALLTRLSGKKLKWGYFLVLILSISFFHLLTPSGKALFHLWGFPITLGSLEQGFMKAITLIGLVFISLSSVKPGLQFPGELGGLMAKTLFYFEEIMKSRKSLKPGKIVARLDQAMLQLEEVEPKQETAVDNNSYTAMVLGICINLCFYGLMLLSMAYT